MAQWMTAWSQAHADMSMLCNWKKDYTARLTVFSDISGEQIRLKLSNQEGKTPANIAGASLQIEDHPSVVMTFDGLKETSLEPGECLYSDPLETTVTKGQLITVSLAFAGTVTSGNILPECVRVSTVGNYLQASSMPLEELPMEMKASGIAPVLPILSAIEVLTEEKERVLVCFGDSITQMSRWTKPLADKIRNHDQEIVVINKGIGGNKLLSDPVDYMSAMFGAAGLKRFEADVLDVEGGDRFDAVLDFDAVLGDSNHPSVMKEYYDSGDHVHPGAIGGIRMAEEAYKVISKA